MTAHKPSILIIDDTPANLKTLGSALSHDYTLKIATSGAEGLSLAANTPPDLVLLDIMMPGMDGYEVCRRLRSHERLASVPVMFITAMAESEVEAAALELGAADFLTKPVRVPTAKLRIRNLLEREAMRRQIEQQRDALDEQVSTRTQSLSIAKEAAERANRLKTTVLAHLNQELRAPMSQLIGMISMARRRTQDTVALEALSQAEAQAGRLLSSLTGWVDLALVESRRLTIERTRFQPEQVIARALSGHEEVLKRQHVRLEHHNSAKAPLAQKWLLGDPMRIEQVLRELIDNAIKFSQQGLVTVQSSIQTDANGTVWLGYQVHDDGVGIAASDQARVFEPFVQLDGAPQRQRGGTGIGLALAQQLVRLMGGYMTVESAPGQGTTFGVRIPTGC